VMKGIILAGGAGTRLSPLTKVISKQLLPVFDKPMIFYPLTTLLTMGVDEIAIITNPGDQEQFKRLLGSGSEFGASIRYFTQDRPRGLADAPIITQEFLGGDPFVLILGDNLLHGPGLGRSLRSHFGGRGATVLAYQVENPGAYGVVVLDKDRKPLDLVEKPTEHVSNLAIPGLYFFDSQCVDFCLNLKPSTRGELEIIDVLHRYLEVGELSVQVVGVGSAWLDMGSHESLLEAGQYVSMIQSRQGVRIGDPYVVHKNRKEII
jgi:glucose-1-phosphate thymidylyltransferase